MKTARTLAVTAFAGALVSVSTPLAAGQPNTTVDKIAAVVGGEIILMSDVMKEAKAAFEQMQRESEQQQGASSFLEGKMKAVVKSTLNNMIDDEVYVQEAKEMEISVTQEELDQTVANMARENNIDVPTLKKAVEAQGMDYMGYRNQLRKQLLRYKVLNLRVRSRIKITEAEARQHYNDQVRSIRSSGSFEGAHILIRVAPDSSAAQAAAARKKIEEIHQEIQKGGDFAVLAQKYSDDKSTAPYGGSLGRREPGEIPSTMERTFVDMEVGEIVGPIRTSAGFHLLRLNNRDALDVVPFAQIKDKLILDLQEEEMKRQADIWLKERRARMFISVRL
jgi:peptidyl-prolyl cis-trans isomerase SurA